MASPSTLGRESMLTEKITDAKACMEESFASLKRQSKMLDGMIATLQRSHRCWPSRWGWGGMIVLLAYVIFMHSFHDQSHQEQRAIDATLMERMMVFEQRLTLLEHLLVKKH